MTVTASQMKQIERRAAEQGLSYREMMENAGRAVTAFVCETQPVLRTAAVFVGKGNNGGDGLVAARLLRARGVRTVVVLVEGEPVTEDAKANFALLDPEIPVWPIETLQMEQISWIYDADATIDAIYGTGFHGELHNCARAAATLICRSLGKVFAVDLPTGICADTGEAAAGAAMADYTLALHAMKPAHEKARGNCGITHVLDIGIPETMELPQTHAGQPDGSQTWGA